MERKTINFTKLDYPENRFCHKHGLEVEPIYSKGKKKWFWVHTTEEGKACWVNSEEEDQGFQERQEDYGLDNLMGNEKEAIKYD